MARRSRRRLTQIEYEALRREAQVLSKDEHGDKVLLTPQARIIKLFRRKRLFSSALFYPYANRFADAAVRLASLGIPCPQVEAVYRVPAIRRDAVVYPKLDGTELRRTINPAQLRTLAHFLADLHAKGVYFRAAHFGNLLVLPDQSFALIDVSETRFFRRPLSPDLRARNFKPLTSYEQDRDGLLSFGIERFLSLYLQHASFPKRQAQAFLGRLAAVRPIFRDAARSLSRSQT